MTLPVFFLSGVVLLAWAFLFAAFGGINSDVPLAHAGIGIALMTPVALLASAAVFKIAHDPEDQPGRWRAVRAFHWLTFLMPFLAIGFFLFVSSTYKKHSNREPSASAANRSQP